MPAGIQLIDVRTVSDAKHPLADISETKEV